MAEIKMLGANLCMTDQKNGLGAARLLECRDTYRNLSRIPLLASGDERTSIPEGLFRQLNHIPSEAEEIPGGATGYRLCISLLFNACMERRDLPDVLVDGTPALKKASENVLGFFGSGGRVDLLEENSSKRPERGYDIAVLDGQRYQNRGPERFLMTARQVRRCGTIIVVSPKGRWDPFIKKLLRKARMESFQGVDAWALPVSGSLKRRALAGVNEDTEDRGRKDLLELWIQLKDSLYEITGTDLAGQEDEEIEALMPGIVAGMHTMEDLVIVLNRKLDDPELKILCNRVKTTAMDLLLELGSNRTEMTFYQKELNDRTRELEEALDAEAL